MPDGSGEKYISDAMLPISSTLTLYAIYADTTARLAYEIDLNNNWRLSETQTNPDPTRFNGVYESFSNYNQEGGDGTISKMYIRISNLDEFTIYIRSYAEEGYDFAVAL